VGLKSFTELEELNELKVDEFGRVSLAIGKSFICIVSELFFETVS